MGASCFSIISLFHGSVRSGLKAADRLSAASCLVFPDRLSLNGPELDCSQPTTDKNVRILTVFNTRSRLCPVSEPRFRYWGEDVVETLERVGQNVAGFQSDQGRQRPRIVAPESNVRRLWRNNAECQDAWGPGRDCGERVYASLTSRRLGEIV